MVRSEAQKKADAKYEAKRRGKRHHNWNAIAYPDSAPENWRDMLNECMVQWWASPLHNLDVNPDGTPKKPHHHIDISFNSPVSYQTAKRIFDAIGAVMPPEHSKPGTPQPDVLDLRQSLRYFCHLDNPSKAQYSPADATWGGGATPYIDMISSPSDDDMTVCEIQEFIDRYQVKSYKRLCQYVRRNRPEWRRIVLRTGAVALTRYLRSAEYEVTNPIVAVDKLAEVDPELDVALVDYGSGEVIEGETRAEFEHRVSVEAVERAELAAGNWATNAVLAAYEHGRRSAGSQ